MPIDLARIMAGQAGRVGSRLGRASRVKAVEASYGVTGRAGSWQATEGGSFI